MRDVDALNRAVAEHVAEVREQLERGREEIERQKQVLQDLQSEEAAAA